MERKCQIVFLEDKNGELSLKDKKGNLFILSDEEIKEGDWKYNSTVGVWQHTREGKSAVTHPDTKKIITTTDSLLTIENLVLDTLGSGVENIKLPQPSQSFLEEFVREYNKGNVIKEVMVEYEEIPKKQGCFDFGCTCGSCRSAQTILKINPKDNTITTKKVKDSWNREELNPIIEFIKELAFDDLDRVSPGLKNKAKEKLKLIEQNL